MKKNFLQFFRIQKQNYIFILYYIYRKIIKIVTIIIVTLPIIIIDTLPKIIGILFIVENCPIISNLIFGLTFFLILTN